MTQRNDLLRLINECEHRLQMLEAEAGTFGFHTPPHITMEIGNIEATLRALSAEVAKLDRQEGGARG